MDVVKLNVTGLATYRGREGHLTFLLHRLTGLGTLLFLTVHILDTATVFFFPNLYNHAIELYRSTPMMLGEIVLVFSVIYHGVNGARIALFDLFFTDKWNIETQRKTAVWVLVIALCSGRRRPSSWVATSWSTTSVCSEELNMATLEGQPVKLSRSLDATAWRWMRYSGLLLIPLAWFHVLLQDVVVGVHQMDINYVAMRWANLGWRVYTFSLLAFAFAHGVNGFRQVMVDYVHGDANRRRLSWALLIFWLVISLIGGLRSSAECAADATCAISFSS
jgi:succinate dehydrogenase cytochrome b556 subunit